MLTLQIEDLEELRTIFREKSVNMTTSIRGSIQEAFEKKKKTAALFEIHVRDSEESFEISLPVTEWFPALENCLKHYQEWKMADEAIDTYLLIKELKEKNYE